MAEGGHCRQGQGAAHRTGSHVACLLEKSHEKTLGLARATLTRISWSRRGSLQVASNYNDYITGT